MKVTVKRLALLKQNSNVEYEHLEDFFGQLRSDYWSMRGSLDEANKRIELLESFCRIHGIFIPEETPF